MENKVKAICPKNSEHARFITVAHVSQDWVVDSEGNFIYQFGPDLETVADPNPGNTWTCKECGANATVKD